MLISITFMTCALSMEAGNDRPEVFSSGIGTELENTGKEYRAGLMMEHSIGEKWSVFAGVSLPVPDRLNGSAGMERDIRKTMYFRFWPTGTFNGPYLGIGSCHSDLSGYIGNIEAGYLCRIWDGITIGISRKTCLTKPLRMSLRQEKSISLKLIYLF